MPEAKPLIDKIHELESRIQDLKAKAGVKALQPKHEGYEFYRAMMDEIKKLKRQVQQMRKKRGRY